MIKNRHGKFDHSHIEDFHELNDELERSPMVDAIAADLQSERPPKVVGIYGSWGSGKSYLLSLVLKKLNATSEGKHIIPICYYPWRYELEGDLASGLIKTLMDTGKKLAQDATTVTKIKTIGMRLLRITYKVAKAHSDYGDMLASAKEAIQDELDNKTTPHKLDDDWVIPRIDEVQGQMSELINCIIGNKGDDNSRIVIFIDDLDRCSPPNMVKLFEWMKVHFSVEGVSYVIALDHVAAARAIVGRYEKYLGSTLDLSYGFRYLEKLIEHEYELGSGSNRLLHLAIKRVFNRDLKKSSYPIAVLLHSEWFDNITEDDLRNTGLAIEAFLGISSIQTPRTLLKIMYKFKLAMDIAVRTKSITSHESTYWIILFSTMYYTLDPFELDLFARKEGALYVNNVTNGAKINEDFVGIKQEIAQVLRQNNYKQGFSESASNIVLSPLLKIVRENSAHTGKLA